MFCAGCDHRPARCLRRCEHAAHGEHLWRVIQIEMHQADAPHLAWDRQSGDVQRAFIEGARAMREMGR
jgi:hypothetical protein